MVAAATASEQWRLGHRPALDGLRGLAVLLVLVGHLLPPITPAAGIGVTLFFVLSGFLITSLLWEEKSRTGRIDVGAFYRRRIRRLLPAFVVVSVLTFASMVAIGQAAQGAFNGIVAASYVSNWAMAAGHWLGPLSHTWSLAIEEQFYLAWPLLLLIGVRYMRPSRLTLLLVGSVVAVQMARTWAAVDGATGERLGFTTFLQADGLLLGCAIAIVMHRRPIRLPRRTGPIALGLAVALAFLLPGGLYFGFGNTVAVLVAGLLVAALVSSPRPDPLFENRWLGRVGLISYGLYLWHYPILWQLGFFQERAYPGLVAAVIGVALTFGAAVASYLWVERRFLSSSHRPPAFRPDGAQTGPVRLHVPVPVPLLVRNEPDPAGAAAR